MQLFKFFPGTSSLYAHNQSCAYVISADEDKVVNVTFLEFHLEDHNDHCHDWLQIHDGRDSTAHLIGRFCGTNNPPNFVSTTNKVYMWFDSDGMNLFLFFSAVCLLDADNFVYIFRYCGTFRISATLACSSTRMW